MARYILSRLAGLLGVLVVVSFITFALMHAVPGGPFDARALERQQMIPEQIKRQLNTKYGLDEPIWKQYLLFVRNAVRLDFGYSLAFPSRTVVQIFKEQWPYSVQLGLLTLAFSTVVGHCLGIASAVRPNSWIDHAGTAVSVFCLVIPSFVFAVLLQFVLSVRLGWLPTGGWDGPLHWVMPVLANSLAPILVLQRYTRSSMRDAMRAGYVRTARAKGLSERTVVYKHVLKNGLIPVVTILGLQLGVLLAGAIITEKIFGWPGLGLLLVEDGIGKRDYRVVQGCVLVISMTYIIANLLTDMVYRWLDPRIRVG